MRKYFNFGSKSFKKKCEKTFEKLFFFIFFAKNKTQSAKKIIFKIFFVEETWNYVKKNQTKIELNRIWIENCSVHTPLKKRLQTLKIGSKMDTSSLFQQITPTTKKKHKIKNQPGFYKLFLQKFCIHPGNKPNAYNRKSSSGKSCHIILHRPQRGRYGVGTSQNQYNLQRWQIGKKSPYHIGNIIRP